MCIFSYILQGAEKDAQERHRFESRLLCCCWHLNAQMLNFATLKKTKTNVTELLIIAMVLHICIVSNHPQIKTVG